MNADRAPEYYDVFARRKPAEPLEHIGTLGASEPADAEVFALKLYDQWKWSEQFVVRQADIVEVVRTP